MGYFKNEYFKPATSLISVLNEAYILDSKYGVGDLFVVKPDKFIQFNSKLKAANSNFIVTKENNLWEKSNKTPKTIITTLNFGSPSEFAIIKNVKKPKVLLRIEGNNGSDLYFNRIKKVDAMIWDETSLETAAAIGLYTSFSDDLKTLTNKSTALQNEASVKTKIETELNKEGDWNQKGRSTILAQLPKIAYKDLLQLIYLSEGMNRFYNEVIKSHIKKPYFIHGLIGKFYEIERKQLKISGLKDNTSDLLISSVPATKFIEALSTVTSIDVDRKSGVCTIPNTTIKFVQCSLKKSATRAQLGKITTLIMDMFSIPSYESLAGFALEESTITEGFISDGIEGIKKLGKVVYDSITKVVSIIKDLPKVFLSSINLMIPSQVKKDLNFLESDLGLSSGSLTECYTSVLSNVINEATKKKVESVPKKSMNGILVEITNDPEKCKKLIGNVNKRYNDLISYCKKHNNYVYMSTPGEITKDSKLEIGDVNKLLTNFTSLYIMKSIISTTLTNKDTTKLLESLFSIQKEMLFGRSDLPIYKVYGLTSPTDTSHTYEYLGSVETFTKNKISSIGDYSNLIVALRCNKQNDKYFAIEGYILSDVDIDDNDFSLTSYYSAIRFSSNQGDYRWSYVVEGTKTVSLDYIKTNVINKGSK